MLINFTPCIIHIDISISHIRRYYFYYERIIVEPSSLIYSTINPPSNIITILFCINYDMLII